MKPVRPLSGVVKRLEETGLRPTRQRLALARLLFGGGDRHVTAEQLHAEAKANDVTVSLATVYNTLHQLTEVGLLRELVVSAGRSFFDTNVTEHYHFYAEADDLLYDIEEQDVELSSLPSAPQGFEVERVDIIVRVKESGQ
jgi:Fur family iron response transcriptional regulator